MACVVRIIWPIGREGGEYSITATYSTAVSPAPKGAKEEGEGFGRVLVPTLPVKIKVVEARKKEPARKGYPR